MEPEQARRRASSSREPARAVALSSVDPLGASPRPTGVGELDRVLSGGLAPGSLTLLYGEPGVGKSTLALQVLLSTALLGSTALLVSAEETPAAVRARAGRLGTVPAALLILSATDLDDALAAIEEHRPSLVVLDSIQTLRAAGAPGTAGSLAQVRAVVEQLGEAARSSGAAVVVIGHVTKEGDPAGPRSLEHLVDTVLAFDGDRHHRLRFARAVKHRFGPTGELGLFEMTAAGLVTLADPGALLAAERRHEVPGSAVTALLEGSRPLLVEVQALVARPTGGGGRTSASGVDARRLASLLAVLECRVGIELAGLDVFVSATGGLRASEPAADLAIALAVASAAAGIALPESLLVVGEVGLAGEVREVGGVDRRLAEAERLGYRAAIAPVSSPAVSADLEVLRVTSVTEAVVAARRWRHGAPGTATNSHSLGAAPPGTLSAWSTVPAAS